MRLFESNENAWDRQQMTGDRLNDNAMQEFVPAKSRKKAAGYAKDTVEVVRDAVWEGVAKDVVYEGLVKRVLIGVPSSLYRMVRPAAAAAPAAPSAPVPASSLPDEGASTTPAAPKPLAEIELPGLPQGAKAAHDIGVSAADRRNLLRNRSLQKQRSMRPMAGALPHSTSANARMPHGEEGRVRRELQESLSLRRSGTQRYQDVRHTDPVIAEAEDDRPAATASEVNSQFKSSSSLESNLPNYFAVVRSGKSIVPMSVGSGSTAWKGDIALPFDVSTQAPMMKQLLAALLKDVDFPKDIDLSKPSTLVARLRGPDFQEEVADPIMQLGKVKTGTRANGESVDVDEQVFFTIFDGLLRRGREGVGSAAVVEGKPLYDFLADARSVEFYSTNAPLMRFLNERMHSDTDLNIRDLRVRLALFEVATLNYFENAEIKEATKEFLAGTIVGAVGELGIEFIPEINKKANIDWITYALNVLLGGGIDFIDNYKGRMGAVTMGAANADPAALAQQQRAALRASAFGAIYGTVANIAAQ